MSDTSPSTTPSVPPTPPDPWWIKPAIAGANKALFGVVLVAAMVINLHDILMIMAGAVINMAMNPDGYYFGSSSGSARKDAVIAASGPVATEAKL